MGRRDAVATFVGLLKGAQREGYPVSVYSDPQDTHNYLVGFVEIVGVDCLILNTMTSKGEPDGRQLVRLFDIHRVDAQTGLHR